jgi:hypothetical protein
MKNYFPKCTFLLNVFLFFFLQIRDKFYDVQKQLHQASKWREAIVGEPYDIKIVHIQSNLYIKATQGNLKMWPL